MLKWLQFSLAAVEEELVTTEIDLNKKKAILIPLEKELKVQRLPVVITLVSFLLFHIHRVRSERRWSWWRTLLHRSVTWSLNLR